METQDKLSIEIGTAEGKTKLTPQTVKVIDVNTESVTFGDKTWDAIILMVKHPEAPEPIGLRKIKFEKEGKLKIVGLSLSLDKDAKISKVSALASLMNYYKAPTIKGLIGKDIQTALDDKGYLVVKAY